MRCHAAAVTSALAVLAFGCASTGHVPSPVRGEATQGWIEKIPGSYERLLKVRNDSRETIRLRSVTLFDCFNVRQVCGEAFPWGAVIAPGETAQMRVTPVNPGISLSFRYAIALEQVDPVAAAVDTRPGYEPPAGGGVVAGADSVESVASTVPARPIRTPAPDYPPDLQGVRGTVVLKLWIDPNGLVTRAEVLEAAAPALGALAREAALAWEFAPATAAGRPVASTVTVPVTF